MRQNRTTMIAKKIQIFFVQKDVNWDRVMIFLEFGKSMYKIVLIFPQKLNLMKKSFPHYEANRKDFVLVKINSFFSSRNPFRKAWYQLLEVDTKHV